MRIRIHSPNLNELLPFVHGGESGTGSLVMLKLNKAVGVATRIPNDFAPL